MSGSGDVRSGTVPVCGLQYITSPSLPSAVKAAQDTMRTTSSKTLPLIAGAAGSFAMSVTSAGIAPPRMDTFPHSTLQLYDSYYGALRDTESALLVTSDDGNRAECNGTLTLPDDLSGIGPSARRLLQLDAAQQQQQRAKKSGSKKSSRAPAVSPVASRLLPTHLCKLKAVTTAPAAAVALSPTALLPSPPPKLMGAAACGANAITATLRSLDRTMDVSPPVLPSNITNPVHGGGYHTSTVPAAAVTPPLVKQLQSYIKRELVLNSGGTAIPSAMDQLNPYREAFRALGSAFPAYASLFDDIQCAYDNVIQAQAELLTEAYAAVVARRVEKVTQQENVTALNQQVGALQKELSKMEETLQSRVQLQEEERQHFTTQRPRVGRASDGLELHRDLEAATQRVSELERKSQIDLEKILVLIGAVRECDRRLKEYERLVTSVMGQVSELDEFKRIAGDAQSELERFRKKYADYVPASDFRLMREHLTAELVAAQLMTRRWRRTATVRGTQLDVMQCRLKALEEDREALVKAAAAATTRHSEAQPHDSAAETVLTPRPSWRRLYERYPELSAYAADVGQLTTGLDGDADGIDAIVRENRSSARDDSTSSDLALDLPTVKGPKETRLQVEYLVERIVALEGLLRTQRKQQLPRSSLTGLVGKGEESMDPANTNSEKNSREVSVAAKDKPTGTPALLQHRNSRRTHGHVEASHSAFSSTSVASAAPRSAPPLELPLLGLGYGPQVHLCWRASGVLSRCSVAPSTIVSMVYHFFLDVLPTFLEQEDKVQQAGDQGVATALGSTDRLAPFLYEFLQAEMQVREDLGVYDSVAHLIMNVERDGERREGYSDALHLFLWIAHGVMPPRIGVEAAVIVAQVKHDIRALSKELQSSRVRRQALGECLQPLLELKTPAEMAELRAALGGETTFSAEALCSDTHLFMQVLLKQECRAGMELYLSLLHALTMRARFMTAGEGCVAATASAAAGPKSMRDSKVPPAPLLAESDRVLLLADVSAAILEVEPCTPEVVLRELSLNAVSKSVQVPASGHVRGEAAGDTTTSKASASEELLVVVRLSDMVHAIGAAPLLRRTRRSSKTDCEL
ncbi:hypothetical protein CUR178_03160 [Leishmania enriettii]|uniref:Translin-associated factor X-interacting protein 1 N-terminal domain-containing protein n=1 Tax=Leishmania enriettii TaxID=5663 RepID=A0A836KJT2_LEIEN|nr:hypothetical protein CUR178_03160 [Leishmania enriettii]